MGIQRGLEGRCRRGTFQPIVSHASSSSSSSLSTISSCCRLPNSTTSLGPPSADTDSNCAASASIAASPSAHLARTVARTSSSRLSSLKMSSRVNLADPSSASSSSNCCSSASSSRRNHERATFSMVASRSRRSSTSISAMDEDTAAAARVERSGEGDGAPFGAVSRFCLDRCGRLSRR
ncbi:hypothetical protein BJY59DRAFT_694956 [Rhodotorula toruloides]